MSQLGLGLGLTRGGVIPFNPLSLDPYLLFDTRSSMIGTLENPTLDLDPSDPSSLDIITATRAGVATYTDADGVIQTASPNTVRVDHVDGVPMILVEPAATNGFTHSEGINNYSTLGRANCTYSLDSTPFGGFNSSCKITSNTFTNSSISSVVKFNSVSGESNYFTFRVKKKNGWFLYVFAGNGCEPSSIHLGLSGEGYISSGGTTANSYLVEEFDDYFLIGIETLQNGTTSAGLLNLRFFNNSSLASYDLDTIEEFFVTGIQWENNSTVATSYIPTSGSTVTRNADQLVIEGSDFTDFYNQSEGTVYFEGNCKSRSDPRLFEFSDGTASNRTRIDINNGTGFRILVYSGSMIVNEEVPFTGASSLFRTALSFKVNDLEGSLNGQSVINETPSSLPTLNQLHVGSNHNGAAGYLNGHIKRLIYWPYHSDDL